MWPFKRKSEAPAASGPQPVPAPAVRRDWAALPPIQRTVGEHPLTAPSDRFSDDLATHHDPSVSSDQMGHQVSAEAPAGIVLTVARSASTRSDGPAMIPRPRVQRRAMDAATESGEWDGDGAAPTETRPNPVPAVIQRIAVVERPAVEPLPELPPLTALPVDAQPMPVASAARRQAATPLVATTVSRQAEFPDAIMTPPRLTLGQARRLGLGAPITKVPERAVQRAVNEPAPPPEVARPSEAQTSDVPSAAIETTLTPASATAVQREAQATEISPIDGPGVQASTGRDSPRLDLPLASGIITDASNTKVAATVTASENPPTQPAVQRLATTTEPARAPLRPQATLQRAVERAGEVMAVIPSPSNPEPRTPVVQRASATPAASTLPLASNHPMRSAADTETGGPTTALPPSLPSPASVASSREAADAPLVGTRSIAMLQRSTETVPSTDSFPPLQPLSDEGAGTVPGHREIFATASPSLASPVGNGRVATAPIYPSLQRSIVEVFTTPALTLPQRGSEKPQGASTLTLPKRGRESLAEAPTPTLPQTGRENSELYLAPTAIQRASDPGEDRAQPVTEPPASLAGFLVQRTSSDVSRELDGASASASAPSPPAAADRTSERDMDELAGKLYDRIRSKLRAELLVDRERAGLLTDWR